MTIGSVNCSPSALHTSDAVTADARRSASPNRQNLDANASQSAADNASSGARPEFVLGASAYRRVLATLELERSSAPDDGGEQNARRAADVSTSLSRAASSDASANATAIKADAAATSYTGQRALRSYQDSGQLSERESLSSLFGVDLFV
ncbi:hypothetical protein HPT27_11790 [Permianibacter sp. IMCC34836]|uniref:hypothetical protein n=1 Tax=Permianibacter fluminis TaxID=2738515 RepID=UPI001552BC48|nr:hypothetical protein [Permianibacter fluminis]NQD37708.1 hypothetical protein [Permianibacter fluminis]